MNNAMAKAVRVVALSVVGVLFGLGATGCASADSTGSKKGPPAPVIESVEKRSISIGEEFEVTGRNLLRGDEGESYLRFKGKFHSTDGDTNDVDFRVPMAVLRGGETKVAKWLRFGPFTNPFTSADQAKVGYFEGRLVGVNEYPDGRSSRQTVRRNFRLQVEPSIEILELQPKNAKCGMAALRGFAGIPYELKVRAAGFVPSEFKYQITTTVKDKTNEFSYEQSHSATGPKDTFSDKSGTPLVFHEVPTGARSYDAVIRILAKDQATGRWVENVMPFPIHRPIEVHYDGNFEVAQHYAPEPVTACLRGQVGNRVTYSETETEVRQRTVSVEISQSWSREHAKTRTEDWRQGYSLSEERRITRQKQTSFSRQETNAMKRGQSHRQSRENSFQFGTEKGEYWEHSVGGGASAEIPDIASVNAEYGYKQGEKRSESKDWGKAVTEGESKSIEKSYSLSESMSSSRSFTDTKARQRSRTYNFGVSAGEEKRVSVGMTKAETNTWTRSSEHSTLTSYEGFIPVGKFGVFYRQTIRMVRQAEVINFNACGQSKLMGKMYMNEWNWAPALAIGDTCQKELPDPELPDKACHIPPCD